MRIPKNIKDLKVTWDNIYDLMGIGVIIALFVELFKQKFKHFFFLLIATCFFISYRNKGGKKTFAVIGLIAIVTYFILYYFLRTLNI